ncbi:acyl-CoA desaturase [Rosistilla carotiformis]|uniref:acyl-CoA desaturase n=1 Tax=Rosistilla carotiformis TaxID=2528017 RepID=UPI0018D21640|nr:acyl-CoA desaturase [Rosistilla carotiformis]
METDIAEPRKLESEEIAWARLFGLIAMHLGCLGLVWVSWSVFNIAAAIGLYLLRAFALTAFYHRYFAHRAFKTSRPVQFAGALIGLTALQKGPLWWAAHHRHHHRQSDQPDDVHSPIPRGFIWSHFGWILADRSSEVRENLIRDWLRFPELRWLERLSMPIGVAFALLVYVTGEVLNAVAPTLQTSGLSLLIWVFFVSTVALYHATYSVNSFAHIFGRRRFATRDNSRNNLPVALLTLGEGWHNNHHHYQSSARQGFVWWEIDISYYTLWMMSKIGLVWGLRGVPKHIMQRSLQSTAKA